MNKMNALKKKLSKLGRSMSERKLGDDSSSKGQKAANNKAIENPTEFDILLGRGKVSFNHVGNRRFRVFINLHLRQYMDAVNRMEKTLVVNSVVEAIQDAGGRFLKHDPKTDKFYQVNPKMAREKVGHALRDAVSARQKLAAGGDDSQNSRGVEGSGGMVPPIVGRRASASEIIHQRVRRASVMDQPSPNVLLPPNQTVARFSRSCGDVQDETVKSCMVRNMEKAILELAEAGGDATEVTAGILAKLHHQQQQTLPQQLPRPLQQERTVSGGIFDGQFPIPASRKPVVASRIASTISSQHSDTSSKSSKTQSRMNYTKHLNTNHHPWDNQSEASPDYSCSIDKSSYDQSTELSVMSEATNKKWFDIASGEFSVTSVDSKVFEDMVADNAVDDDDVDPNLVDKVNKALSDIDYTSASKKSGLFRKKSRAGKLKNSLMSSASSGTSDRVELSEEFSTMSLDTRTQGTAPTDDMYPLKSEEFGLKPAEELAMIARMSLKSDEFTLRPNDCNKTSLTSSIKSQEFGLKSVDYLKGIQDGDAPSEGFAIMPSLLQVDSTEFAARSKDIDLLRQSGLSMESAGISEDFSLKSKDFERLTASQTSNMSGPRGSSSTEFLMKMSKAADLYPSPRGSAVDMAHRSNSKTKISWNLGDETSGRLMATVDEMGASGNNTLLNPDVLTNHGTGDAKDCQDSSELVISEDFGLPADKVAV